MIFNQKQMYSSDSFAFTLEKSNIQPEKSKNDRDQDDSHYEQRISPPNTGNVTSASGSRHHFCSFTGA
jgi:hypothetical protein